MKSRKELKDEYKQRKSPMGVFQIRNACNQRILVEGSADLVAIWNRQKFQLKNGLHPNKKLQADWNEYGEENFRFEILSEIQQKEDDKDYRKELKGLEQMYIDELQPFGDKGYNPDRMT